MYSRRHLPLERRPGRAARGARATAAAPASMRSSLRKRARYSHHCSVFSAGRLIASMIFGCGSAAASSASVRSRAMPWPASCSTKAAMSGRALSKWRARRVAVAGAGEETGAAQGEQQCGAAHSQDVLRSHEFAARIQAHQDTEAGQQRHDRRAAVADERQRHADDRQQAADHAGVDEHVQRRRSARASRRAGARRCPGLRREVHGARDRRPGRAPAAPAGR